MVKRDRLFVCQESQDLIRPWPYITLWAGALTKLEIFNNSPPPLSFPFTDHPCQGLYAPVEKSFRFLVFPDLPAFFRVLEFLHGADVDRLPAFHVDFPETL